MSNPIRYFASATKGSEDNILLAEIESECGSYLEKLTPAQKAAWVIALITETVEPEGVEVDYLIPSDVPMFEYLFELSHDCKLDLAAAMLTYLRESVEGYKGKSECVSSLSDYSVTL